MIASAGFVAGGICSLLVADKIERKYQIAFASVVMGAAFILRGIFIDHYDGLVISSFIAFGANACLITSLIMYTGESFPTKIRSTCSGIVEGIGRLVATTEPLIFIMLEPFGFFNFGWIVLVLFCCGDHGFGVWKEHIEFVVRKTGHLSWSAV
jgi:MFS family permease